VRRKDRDEVLGSEDVIQRRGQGFAMPGRARELSHQEVGVEQKHDKADFDQRADNDAPAKWTG